MDLKTVYIYCVAVCSIRMARRGGSQTTAALTSLRWSGKTKMISYVKPVNIQQRKHYLVVFQMNPAVKGKHICVSGHMHFALAAGLMIPP